MADNAPKEKAVKATLADVYAGYAEKATGKEPFEFSLLETYDVKFTKDFRGVKKGHTMLGISLVAKDLYDANGVIEVLKKTEAPADADKDE